MNFKPMRPSHNKPELDLMQFQQAPDYSGLFDDVEASSPRYASYPTADRFVEAYRGDDYRLALTQRSTCGAAGACAPLGIYIHLPFCQTVCHHCACRVIETRDPEMVSPYLDALEREMVLVADALGEPARVSHLQLGGGTPTFLSDAELARLMGSLHRHFKVLPDADLTIAVDPRTVTRQRLRHLASLGFQRLSVGVQELDPRVLQALNRNPAPTPLAALMDDARAIGFLSVNIDLVYGLPLQTVECFARTVGQVLALAPHRLGLHAYAHQPGRNRPQRQIDSDDLPGDPARLIMRAQAQRALQEHGYDHIGLDHYAQPQDALALARRQGRLHRNLQGYTAVAEPDLIGLGLSAVGRIGPGYVQNAPTLTAYSDLLLRGELPVVKGLSLNRDDLLRRSVIMALMCHGRVSFESIALAHLIDFRRYFANEIEQMELLADRGWLTLQPDAVVLTPQGEYAVRQVAAVFDRHLQADRARGRYSRVI